MSLRCIFRVALFGVAWGFIANSNAALVYDESSTGDLSNNGLNATFVSLSAGANEIRGSTGKGTSTITDRDYFTVSVPVGLQLSSLVVLPGTAVSGDFSFIGLQSGSQLSVSPSTSDATGLLGWRHYSSVDLN